MQHSQTIWVPPPAGVSGSGLKHQQDKRYLYVDSSLAPVVDGGLTVAIPDPYQNVSKITLKEALVPRTDQLLYVLLGLRCNSNMRPSLLQLGADPNSATSQNSNSAAQNPRAYNLTKVTPHLPIFAELSVASAQSIAQLNTQTLDVQYASITHYQDEMCSYTFRPPLTSLHTVELQLYKPPASATSYDLPPYDVAVYKVSFASALSIPSGTDITSRVISDNLPSPTDFTATVLTVDSAASNIALVGNISSLAAFKAFVKRLDEDGVTVSEQSLYTADNANSSIGQIPGSTRVTSLATTVLLLFEVTCDV